MNIDTHSLEWFLDEERGEYAPSPKNTGSDRPRPIITASLAVYGERFCVEKIPYRGNPKMNIDP